MKIRLALGIACLMLVSHRSAIAQDSPGNISVFADNNASSCALLDQNEEQFTVYVFHTNVSGMAFSDFRVTASGGFSATYLNETYAQPGHVGDFRNGISLAYGLCMNGPLLLGSISYQGHGTSASCSYLDVVAWRYPWPATEDCSFEDHPAPPLGKLYVNPSPQCQPFCTVATQPTTWGSVKALYR